jgi:hypothetical protein
MFTEEQQRKFDKAMGKFKDYQKGERCDPFFIDAEKNLAGFVLAYIIATGDYSADGLKAKIEKLGKGHPAYVYYKRFNSLPPKAKEAAFMSCSIALKKMLKDVAQEV